MRQSDGAADSRNGGLVLVFIIGEQMRRRVLAGVFVKCVAARGAQVWKCVALG